jgi:hypothetical protein
MAAYRRINAATQEEVISSLSFYFLTLFWERGSIVTRVDQKAERYFRAQA